MEERALRPSLLYAGIEVARHMRHTGATPDEAVAHLRQGDAQVTSFDYTGATDLASGIGWNLFSAAESQDGAFRETLGRWLAVVRPVWRDFLPLGRRRTLAMLHDNETSCLEVAGLLGDQDEVLAWWDRVAQEARSAIDDRRLLAGRRAEALSLERERLRLAGTDRTPIWTAIEDNGAGYDIQTFRDTEGAPAGPRTPSEGSTIHWHEHYIEVKYAGALTIHLSAHEWRQADLLAQAWELQIWRRDAVEPEVLTLEEVRPHVPENQGLGRWESVEIPVSALLGRAPVLSKSTQPRSSGSIDV